jgi:hypothetical protein
MQISKRWEGWGEKYGGKIPFYHFSSIKIVMTLLSRLLRNSCNKTEKKLKTFAGSKNNTEVKYHASFFY